MQSLKMISVIAAMAAVAPGIVLAEGRAKACGEASCAARDAQAGAVDAAAHCRKVVREKGPVSRFRAGGRELSDAELRACNRFTIVTQPPRN